MRFQKYIAVLVIAGTTAAAQVASHAPTRLKAEPSAKTAAATPAPKIADKAVARVNGVALTESDLLREMYAMFPYAQQHNGFPKKMEPEIRRGALEMIIFEELLYQEAKRRKLTIPQARLASAEAEFRKQFSTQAEYQEYLKTEMNGSRQALREKIQRSLLIERMLRTEVVAKATMTPAQVKAYYDSNPKQFEHGEMIHIQSISILPPNETPGVQKEARKRAEDALKAAKATKDYRDFGLLAEQISDDDFHVNYGDHKPVASEQLPPEIVKAAHAMKPGQVSDLIQLGSAYTIFRLVSLAPAGKTPFAEVKNQLQADLQKQRTEQVRSALGQKLRKDAKIERL